MLGKTIINFYLNGDKNFHGKGRFVRQLSNNEIVLEAATSLKNIVEGDKIVIPTEDLVEH